RFGSRSTSTGPRAYEIFTSVGNYSTAAASGELLNNSVWALQTATFANPVSGIAGTPITVRLYGTNGTGSPTTNTANWRIDDLAVTVRVPPAAPSLTTQPLSQTVPEGGSASFTAAMSSPSPVSYLWRKNGVVISGQTGASLTLTNVTSADNGSYRAVLTNDGGSIVSAAATLTVVEAPTSAVTWTFDTAAPTSGLPVGVTGGTVTQGNNNGTTPLLSTTSASSGYPGSSGGNNAGAAARIGALNTATSGSAFFTFTLTPPLDRRLALELISFGSRSTGTGPQGFTVFTSIDNFAAPLVFGSLNANSTWAVTPLLDAKATGTTGAPVTVRIYGHSGSGNPSIDTANWRIDDLKLTVRSVAALPIVTTHPQSQTIAEGGTTILTVAASGAAPLTYQWRKDGGLIFGASDTTYVIESTSAEDAGSYSIEVTNPAGTVTSNPALIILAQSINFPTPTTRSFGSGAFDLAATASSGLPVTYALVSGPANVTGRTVTPTGVGNVTIRATQNGSADYAAATAVERSFAVQSDYAYWQQTRFTNGELADPARSGPNAIYGTDGVANLLKYALGLEPAQDATTQLPSPTVSGNAWTFTYTRPVDRPDVAYAVERSTDLTNWSTADVTHEAVSTNGATATWRASVPLSVSNQVFFRLRVTR
ncbi:MAG: immunoglobulin domain-containing protein, partial [Candidatus Didemnitutus sp.]|nr:immunoglobulin domain-containing protein [Candidatus Didemnitutus sp.]